MNRSANDIFLGLVSLCFAVPVFAETSNQAPHDFFISVSAGPSWTNANPTQAIALQPDVIDTYVPQNKAYTNRLVNGEVFLGIQPRLLKHIQSQFGIDFYISNAMSQKGSILIDGNPNLEDYSYQYQINHEHIALKSKWTLEQSLNINPYISGSIGVGFNRSYGYAITPLLFQALPMPPFQSNTQVALSYSLGSGIQRTLNQHITVALGYQYVSWGSSHLAPASGQTSNKGLGLNYLSTQGIEFNISYLL